MRREPSLYYYKNFYRIVDSVYSSYWMGKLINVLINKGHRQTVEREVKLACKYLKIQFKVIPLELLLEGIEKVKPVFGIDYVTVGGRKKEFPVFLGPEHQRGLSVRWLKRLIKERKEWYLHQRVLSELVDVREIRRHKLVKQRDSFFAKAVQNKFNLRYAR